MTKLQVLKLSCCHYEGKGCWFDWWLNVLCTAHSVKVKVSLTALKMLMHRNRYTVPQCLFIVACIITVADYIIYDCVAQMLNMNINMFTKSCYFKWTHARSYRFFLMANKLLHYLRHLFLCSCADFRAYLEWYLGSVWCQSVVRIKTLIFLPDNLPILLWTALACSPSREPSSPEPSEKRQSTFDISHRTHVRAQQDISLSLVMVIPAGSVPW